MSEKNPAPAMKTYGLRFHGDLRVALDLAAQEMHLSASDIIRQAIYAHPAVKAALARVKQKASA